ncbi:MAG: 2-amino-4-hydroxy-6-hydroxymethyldihydropteridine diphosphokinase [Deltaproteobacteria bacterium]|nr:2-amino-4-hydroxy-6-hydroxymethyldihydropteridine diphosphokinase [Deltaproteobacteria bacterium]
MPLTHLAYIGLGANLDDRLGRLREAIARVNDLSGCSITGVSSFYRTEPVGVAGQRWYVNGAVRVATSLRPRSLLRGMLNIESLMGRERRAKWDPRVIDLDLLLYGNEIVDQGGLTLPHPLMHERRFVLIPLVELAPDLVHPVLGKTIMDLLNGTTDDGQKVIRIEEE